MRQVIGLIAGGFKPLTKGHYFLIQSAANECDKVYLFVSIKDRSRPGEVEITWEQMSKVWKAFLEKAMPKNVSVNYHSAPIRGIMDILIAANADETNENTYIVYSDEEDIVKNFPDRAKQKYMNRLIANDQVIFEPFKRSSGVNISGTKMRQYLQTGNLEAFVQGLPDAVQLYGPKIYRMLGGVSIKEE
ncbi:MAG: hypothetical protein WC761_01255 [Candidatus Paceibacterota bacterium]